MKLFTVLFLAITAGILLGGCASGPGDTTGASYAEPDLLSTQSQIQEMHNEALRQEF